MNKYIAWISVLIMGAALFIATYLGYMNSDNSWYAIIGRGIADRNLLLNGWVGSTISHYFPYGLTEAFWAFFIHNYRIAHALSIVTLISMLGGAIFLGIKGLVGKTPNIFSVLTPMAIVIAIDPQLLTDSLSHIAPLITMLVATYLYYFARDKIWAKSGIIALLACWTDNYNLVYFLIPIVFENILFFIKTKRIDPMIKWIVLGMIIYAIRMIIFNDVGLYIPGSHRVMQRVYTIIPFTDIWSNFLNAYGNLHELFASIFRGYKYMGLIFPIYFLAFMLFSVYLKYKHGLKILTTRSWDKNRFLTFLLAGIFLIISIRIFTKIPNEPRYLVGPFVNMLIILGWWLNGNKHVRTISIITLVMAIGQMATLHRFKADPQNKERMQIAEIIKNENLNYGVAWFGNALSTNFALNEQRVATLYKKSAKYYNWMIDKHVYHMGKIDFIIAWTENRGVENWKQYDLDDSEIREYFGKPKKVIETKNTRIYIYDDITNKVEKPKLRRGTKK